MNMQMVIVEVKQKFHFKHGKLWSGQLLEMQLNQFNNNFSFNKYARFYQPCDK